MELPSHQIRKQLSPFEVGIALQTAASLSGRQCDGTVCATQTNQVCYTHSMLLMRCACVQPIHEIIFMKSSKITICENLDPQKFSTIQ